MSMFTVFQKGRQAAKEHQAKQAEQKKKEEQKNTPYKHVPKHAAIDALSSGPASSREADRPRILEQNRRRNAMTASGVGLGGSVTAVHNGLPRVHSSLSHVSYPTALANPVVSMPRAHSFSGMRPPRWSHQGGEAKYKTVNASSRSLKGKDLERVMLYSGRASRPSSLHSSRLSPDNSSGDSPVGSSSDSVTSEEDLEMKPLGDKESPHPTRPSQSRRRSDPKRLATPVRPLSYTHNRERESGSRGSSSTSLAVPNMPPVPALPPLQFATNPHGSSATAIGTPSRIKSPSPIPDIAEEAPENTDPENGIEEASPVKQTTPHSQGSPKTARLSERATVNSSIAVSTKTNAGRPAVAVASLPTEFDEASLPPPQGPVVPQQNSSKIMKNNGKRRQWSLRGSKTPAVGA